MVCLDSGNVLLCAGQDGSWLQIMKPDHVSELHHLQISDLSANRYMFHKVIGSYD